MLYFLSGSDRYRLRERERELTTTFLALHPEATRTIFFLDEEKGDVARSVQELLSGGLFATPQVIALREIGVLSDEQGSALAPMLQQWGGGEDHLIIASHVGATKKTGVLVKRLLKIATREEFPAFDPKNPRALALYGKQLIKKIDARSTITEEALFILSERVQGRTGELAQELTKLAVYKNGEKITAEDVEQLSHATLESQVFLALDALVAGRRGATIAYFRREEKLSVPIQKTLGLCAWHIRRLLEIRELYDQGLRDAKKIGEELGMTPYAVQKILPKISGFSLDRLKRGMVLLADLDLDIRSGRIEPGVALDLFVWRF